MRRQDVEHLLAVALAAAGLDAMAEHRLLAVVVHAAARSGTPPPCRGCRIVQPVKRARDFCTSFCV